MFYEDWQSKFREPESVIFKVDKYKKPAYKTDNAVDISEYDTLFKTPIVQERRHYYDEDYNYSHIDNKSMIFTLPELGMKIALTDLSHRNARHVARVSYGPDKTAGGDYYGSINERVSVVHFKGGNINFKQVYREFPKKDSPNGERSDGTKVQTEDVLKAGIIYYYIQKYIQSLLSINTDEMTNEQLNEIKNEKNSLIEEFNQYLDQIMSGDKEVDLQGYADKIFGEGKLNLQEILTRNIEQVLKSQEIEEDKRVRKEARQEKISDAIDKVVYIAISPVLKLAKFAGFIKDKVFTFVKTKQRDKIREEERKREKQEEIDKVRQF